VQRRHAYSLPRQQRFCACAAQQHDSVRGLRVFARLRLRHRTRALDVEGTLACSACLPGSFMDDFTNCKCFPGHENRTAESCQACAQYMTQTSFSNLRGIEFEDADKRSAAPNFAPFRQKSLGDCIRPFPPTQGWLTGLTKNGHAPKGTCGLMGTQHPALLGDHPVVSAQSQLSTCGDASP